MKKRMQLFAILTMFALSLTIVSGASASIIGIENLGGLRGNTLAVRDNQWVAKMFTTGSGSGWNLESVLISAKENWGSNFQVSLYSNSGGAPGTLLSALTGTPPLGSFYTINNYLDQSQTLLSANTSYWIRYSSSDPNAFNLGTYADYAVNTYTGLSGWSFASGANISTDSGSNWSPNALSPMLQIELVNGGGGGATVNLF